MAAMNQNDDEDVIGSINIIPFVDIVLVLLVIFMVTSTVIVKAAIKVDLPKAANAGTAVEDTLNLVVTKERALVLDGEPTTFAAASDTIRARAATNPELQAVISADKRLAYGDVVDVIDMVKAGGVASFALNIERRVAGK
ncbi:MAG: biopolymer transporter ExbD [Proteobacteria bacterium]|jgi:biopolymer transport protein ExbD|nr:biopolymer transporter ExbD [Pseudomonadota bacterium]